MEQGVWQEIEQLYSKFQKLGIGEAVDYDKYYLYSLITHSTAIEGSTLTELETQLELAKAESDKLQNACRTLFVSYRYSRS